MYTDIANNFCQGTFVLKRRIRLVDSGITKKMQSCIVLYNIPMAHYVEVKGISTKLMFYQEWCVEAWYLWIIPCICLQLQSRASHIRSRNANSITVFKDILWYYQLTLYVPKHMIHFSTLCSDFSYTIQ